MNKKYVTIIGIVLAVCLVSSAYALLTNDNTLSSATITNTVSKDISDVNKNTNENNNVDENKNIDENSKNTNDKKTGVEKEIDTSLPIVSHYKYINPIKEHVIKNKLYIEGYNENNERVLAEVPNAIVPDTYVDENGRTIAIIKNPHKEDIPTEDPVQKNKIPQNFTKDLSNVIYC